MRLLTAIFFSSLLCLPFAAMGATPADPLHPWQWKQRILLVDGRTDDLDDLLLLMEAEKAGIDERHLLWFILSDDGVRTNTDDPLPEAFAEKITKDHFEGSDAKAVLVGKDGGVKMREPHLDLADVFARIDRMPMRRAEMRRQ
jgi:hypothetical protein